MKVVKKVEKHVFENQCFALEGRACPHEQSQLCCVNNDADPLMGRAYLNVRATGWERLHPFPWKGEGPWVGVETLP